MSKTEQSLCFSQPFISRPNVILWTSSRGNFFALTASYTVDTATALESAFSRVVLACAARDKADLEPLLSSKLFLIASSMGVSSLNCVIE